MKNEALQKYETALLNYLTIQQTRKLLDRLERISCKVAPLNAATGNTQTVLRWHLDPSSPLYASEEECRKIYMTLVEDLLGLMGAQDFPYRKCLTVYSDLLLASEDIKIILDSTTRIGSLELPVWYEHAPESGGSHVKDNIFWYKPLLEINQLRKLVAEPKIVTKIQVKAYLTDRRQTGDYQTNREVRWETLPGSPQYASRIGCSLIEAKLLAQIFIFVGAPELQSDMMNIVEKHLGQAYVKDGFECPISGKPIYYNEFFEKVALPTHGRSGYQVGHLTPLATAGKHIADNTSWITDLGNRVQGEASLEEITNDIFFMAYFHKNRLKLDWQEIESISKRKAN